MRDVIRRVSARQDSGLKDLHSLFSGGIRFSLSRLAGLHALDDRVDQIISVAAQAIQQGVLRQPQDLAAFVRTAVHNLAGRKTEIMRTVLLTMPKRDREVLASFYLEEKSPRQVCLEFNITESQFHILKSNAKASFRHLYATV